MRSVSAKLVGLWVTSLVAGPAYASSGVDPELAEMRERIEALARRVEAQGEQLEHQRGLLEDTHKVVRERQSEHEPSRVQGSSGRRSTST